MKWKRFTRASLALVVLVSAMAAQDIQRLRAGVRQARLGYRPLEIEVLGRDLMAAVKPGSLEWYEGARAIVWARRYWWSPESLAEIAQEVLREGDAHERELSEKIVPVVEEARALLLEAWQFLGKNEAVVTYTRPRLLQTMVAHGVQAARPYALKQVRIYAQALAATGHKTECLGILKKALSSFDDQQETLAIRGWIQIQEGGYRRYDGKFASDPALESAMEKIEGAVSKARAYLSRRLRIAESDIPETRVALLDSPSWTGQAAAVTVGTWRIPAEDPYTILNALGVAEDSMKLEVLFRHEISHAILTEALRGRYEQMPPWMSEGLAYLVAGQEEQLWQQVLAERLQKNPKAFSDTGQAGLAFFQPSFAAGRRGVDFDHYLALAYLEVHPGPGGFDRFVQRLLSGDDGQEALIRVSGLDYPEFLRSAAGWFRRVLWEKRRAVMIDIGRIDIAVTRGPDEAIKTCRRVLRQGASPLAEAQARHVLAHTLQEQGRLDDALKEWNAFHARRQAMPLRGWAIARGRAMVLRKLGRDEEARRAVRFFVDRQLPPEDRQWLDAFLSSKKR